MATNDNNVRAVSRALDILDFVSESNSSFTLTDISRAIGLTPSTTLRLLSTLEARNYIYRDSRNHRYYLGFKLARISSVAFENLDCCQIAQPYMQELVDRYCESVGIYTMQGDRRVCVARIEGNRPLRSVVQIGQSLPLTCGASGRLLLSYLPAEDIARLVKDDSSLDNSMVHILTEDRRKPYTVSHEERESGVVSIAAPIFNAHGNMVAALFLTGPSTRLDDGMVDKIVPDIVAAARKTSADMGFCSDVSNRG